MTRPVAFAALGGALLVLASTAGQAFAADRYFCHDYAVAAMRQVHMAFSRDRCVAHIDPDSSRWSRDFDRHFEWCRSVSRDQANDERDARKAVLDRCTGRWRDHARDGY